MSHHFYRASAGARLQAGENEIETFDNQSKFEFEFELEKMMDRRQAEAGPRERERRRLPFPQFLASRKNAVSGEFSRRTVNKESRSSEKNTHKKHKKQ